MVYFYCNACGDSLKKNQVQKHYQQQCRNCNILSCVDCGQEFHGSEYEKHTKCISEEEKYSGKNYKPKPNANKGEQKQEQWIEQVQEAILKVRANPRLKSLLEQLKNYPNIPRKRAKFENFLSNSLRVRDTDLAGQAWDAISPELSKSVVPNRNNMKPDAQFEMPSNDDVAHEIRSTDSDVDVTRSKKSKKHKKHVEPDPVLLASCQATADNDTSKSKKKHLECEDMTSELKDCKSSRKNKRKREQNEENNERTINKDTERDKKRSKKNGTEMMECNDDVLADGADDEEMTGSFSWKAAIVGVLKRAPDHQLALKKLRKKVLSEYNARGGDGKVYTEEKLLAKFMHKVSKNSRLKVHKDMVKLVP